MLYVKLIHISSLEVHLRSALSASLVPEASSGLSQSLPDYPLTLRRPQSTKRVPSGRQLDRGKMEESGTPDFAIQPVQSQCAECKKAHEVKLPWLDSPLIPLFCFSSEATLQHSASFLAPLLLLWLLLFLLLWFFLSPTECWLCPLNPSTLFLLPLRSTVCSHYFIPHAFIRDPQSLAPL